MDSELMLDDSSKALEVEEQVRHGKMNDHQILQIMGVLRRSGKDRMETVRHNVPETTRSALVTPGLTVSATSSTLITVEAWGGKGNAAVGAGGTDSGRDPETGATPGQIRTQVSTSTVLGKLGGRLVPGHKVRGRHGTRWNWGGSLLHGRFCGRSFCGGTTGRF